MSPSSTTKLGTVHNQGRPEYRQDSVPLVSRREEQRKVAGSVVTAAASTDVASSVSFQASAAPARACAALHSICRGRAALISAPAPPATPPSRVGKHLVSSGERARARFERPSKLCGVH